MLETGITLAQRYEIRKQLGGGANSHVYLVYDRIDGRNRALKEIEKSSDSRLHVFARREAEIVRGLKYPYFPEIFAILETEESDFLVMEYLQGETAGERLRRLGPRSAEEVLRWGKDLCLMLLYLHESVPPMIYCDMKPDNIMIQPEGNLRLIDFGAVQVCEDAQEFPFMLGTKGYAAPEQLELCDVLDARADIYALGVTMYQLLTGVDPGKVDVSAITLHAMRRTMPRRLARIIRKCTEKERERRYSSCEELREELDRVFSLQGELCQASKERKTKNGRETGIRRREYHSAGRFGSRKEKTGHVYWKRVPQRFKPFNL